MYKWLLRNIMIVSNVSFLYFIPYRHGQKESNTQEGLFAKGNNSLRGALLEGCYEHIPDMYIMFYMNDMAL